MTSANRKALAEETAGDQQDTHSGLWDRARCGGSRPTSPLPEPLKRRRDGLHKDEAGGATPGFSA
jgi:hypothetical protein